MIQIRWEVWSQWPIGRTIYYNYEEAKQRYDYLALTGYGCKLLKIDEELMEETKLTKEIVVDNWFPGDN